jgi:hypothetical protein
MGERGRTALNLLAIVTIVALILARAYLSRAPDPPLQHGHTSASAP